MCGDMEIVIRLSKERRENRVSRGFPTPTIWSISTRPLGRIGIIIPFSAAQVRNTRKMAVSAGFVHGYVKNLALRSGREEKFWK
jgi:hypothetical protein